MKFFEQNIQLEMGTLILFTVIFLIITFVTIKLLFVTKNSVKEESKKRIEENRKLYKEKVYLKDDLKTLRDTIRIYLKSLGKFEHYTLQEMSLRNIAKDNKKSEDEKVKRVIEITGLTDIDQEVLKVISPSKRLNKT